jgi:hypothetical protein
MLNSGNASTPCEVPSGCIEWRFRQIEADVSGEARTTKRSAAKRSESPVTRIITGRFRCIPSRASTHRRKTAKQKHEPRSKLDEEPFNQAIERASKQAAAHIARGFTHDALSKVLYASSNANAKQEFS